jgi:hypothetical protein
LAPPASSKGDRTPSHDNQIKGLRRDISSRKASGMFLAMADTAFVQYGILLHDSSVGRQWATGSSSTEPQDPACCCVLWCVDHRIRVPTLIRIADSFRPSPDSVRGSPADRSPRYLGSPRRATTAWVVALNSSLGVESPSDQAARPRATPAAAPSSPTTTLPMTFIVASNSWPSSTNLTVSKVNVEKVV